MNQVAQQEITLDEIYEWNCRISPWGILLNIIDKREPTNFWSITNVQWIFHVQSI